MDNNKKEFETALFGIGENHITRFHDTYVHSTDDEIRQMDILQEECAELIQAISKMKRIKSYDGEKYVVTRNHLIEEITHVAISSAMVSIQFSISQSDIDLEVQRKDDLLPKGGKS